MGVGEVGGEGEEEEGEDERLALLTSWKVNLG